jgi:hypothetical protein
MTAPLLLALALPRVGVFRPSIDRIVIYDRLSVSLNAKRRKCMGSPARSRSRAPTGIEKG